MSKALDTLWYTRCPVPTGLGIALQRGWLEEAFAQQHTAIKSLQESDDVAVRESHFDHTLQNSVRHGGNIPAIWARAAGRQTRVLGLSWADEIQLILTLPGSGINSVRDLKGRKFGLPLWRNVQIDFARAQAMRALENALRLDGLEVSDVELVDFVIERRPSEEPVVRIDGKADLSTGGGGSRNAELVGLLRGEVDAIFLKGAHAAQLVHHFGLQVVIDTGSHPEPLVRANNGTPRTLTVDQHLLDNHYDSAVRLVETTLRADQWARAHPLEARQFLARETNSNDFWVRRAYGEDANLRLGTNFDEGAIVALQDFTDFLHRWQFIPTTFDVREWIDVGPYEQANAHLTARAA
ncbi:ABC transporter substrate-binding protein [Pseudoduganella sp. FT26W]|uniref:ABC transporter substrate-binding protein n=1 Tax=Duganella aquatilis TaxID=2666082 RepID=A0A844DGN5_9BURK|nr:ABC transporter substrate-binding protein [Duganella aquatilis]MRW87474.1 ABC transporter substrate-binding protein [Duganella aquatilis]